MKDRSKLVFAFAAGALVGASITAFLATNKGKEFMENAKEKFASLGDELNETVSSFEQEFAEALSNLNKEDDLQS